MGPPVCRLWKREMGTLLEGVQEGEGETYVQIFLLLAPRTEQTQAASVPAFTHQESLSVAEESRWH